MKFKFRLDKVLRVRTIEEDQARHELVRRQNELREAEAHLKRLKNDRREVVQFGHSQQDLTMKTATYKYLEHLDSRILKQREVVDQCQVRFNQARDQWFAAKKKKEVLEKLREKRFQEFRLEEERASQKALDDMGTRVRA